MQSLYTFWKRWNLTYVIGIWLIWSIALFLVGAIIMSRVPINGVRHSYSGTGEELSVWTNWDGNNYIMIARGGYSDEPLPLYAFFPLLPVLIKVLTVIFPISYPLAGIIISRLATLGALIFFVKLIEKQWNQEIAYKAAWVLLIFPTSFFMFSVYTESLFLCTTIAAWYFAKEKNWILAGIFGFFSATSRLVGILTTFIIMWEYLSSVNWNIPKIRWGITSVLAPVLGLISYGYYNYVQTGSFLHFLEVQKYWSAHGRGGYHNPLEIVIKELANTFSDKSNILGILGSLDIWFSLFAIGILLWATIRKSLPIQYLFWGWAIILIPIISGSLVSMPRYVLTCFPIYMIIALWCQKNIFFDKLYTMASILLLAALYSMFLFQAWIA
jgi:hypothetical protein